MTNSSKVDYVILKDVFLRNPLNVELNPTCHLLALLGAHNILHVSRLRVKMKNSVGGNLTPPQTPVAMRSKVVSLSRLIAGMRVGSKINRQSS